MDEKDKEYFELPLNRKSGKSTSDKKLKKSKEESGTNALTKKDSFNHTGIKKKDPKAKKSASKKKTSKREKLKANEVVKSEQFSWKVAKILGSGGFGDVYLVQKENNADKKQYAMKTEMVYGQKRMLRLKIEVSVLKQCHEIKNPKDKKHFVEFIDRGITDKFKFLVMGLVGPSLEDIRKDWLLQTYSKSTAMQSAIQTLKGIQDLHNVGWLHRDIKPANYAVGIEEKESIIYLLDFGIARKIFKGDTRDVKIPRSRVKFLGTLRFASRACHRLKEQGRKDDMEVWLYMVYDLFDELRGLPWKRAANKEEIVKYKEKFFRHEYPKVYKIVPKEFKRLLDYLNQLSYEDEPDYKYLTESLVSIAKENKISLDKKLDWAGKLKKKRESMSTDLKESSTTSSDNRQSGSDSNESSRKSKKKAISARRLKTKKVPSPR